MGVRPQGPVAPGELIAGKYRVERELGAGGMGVVVLAMHVELERRVAIKFLAESLHASPDVVERFAREARAAARLHSEHVAKVLDVGRLASGAPYYVMEMLVGQDLAQLVKAQGALSPHVACDYVLQVCEAIAEAHALGIVHRDLKPANIFVSMRPDGSPIAKVLDFGISKVRPTTGVGDGSLTASHSSMGSPLYMSPEQLRSARNADARSDIWSIGVVLYELITGRTPFGGETLAGVCAAIAADTPEPLRRWRPEVPPALDAIVVRCLDKDPTRRFQDVGEVAIALAPFAPPTSRNLVERAARLSRAGALHGTTVPRGPDAPAPAATDAPWSASALARPRPPIRVRVLGVAAVTLVATGTFAAWLLQPQPLHPMAGAPSASPVAAPATQSGAATSATPSQASVATPPLSTGNVTFPSGSRVLPSATAGHPGPGTPPSPPKPKPPTKSPDPLEDR